MRTPKSHGDNSVFSSREGWGERLALKVGDGRLGLLLPAIVTLTTVAALSAAGPADAHMGAGLPGEIVMTRILDGGRALAGVYSLYTAIFK